MSSEDSGITMEVYTDLPGVQMYTANFLDGEPGKDGASYVKRSAVCLETQMCIRDRSWLDSYQTS